LFWPRYRSKYDDTKVDILEAVFSILQETGQELVTGWPTLLSILQVPTINMLFTPTTNAVAHTQHRPQAVAIRNVHDHTAAGGMVAQVGVIFQGLSVITKPISFLLRAT
jgi:hypothetical protein